MEVTSLREVYLLVIGEYVMDCGPWCVYYRDRDKLAKDGICSSCPHYGGSRARFDLGKVDSFRLARMLAEKKEKERRDKILKLSDCPHCCKPSLFYNSVDDSFECLNLECPVHSIPITADTEEYKSIIDRN